MTTVLICDDDVARIRLWESRVRSQIQDAQIHCYSGERLAGLVDALYRREQQARGAADEPTSVAREFLVACDGADIVLLDSDLSPTARDLGSVDEDKRTEVSQILRNGYGDAIARQVRSYTRAKLIVVANMFWGRHQRSRVFDLTMVQEELSHADVNIEDAELGDDSLWRSVPPERGKYNPWKRPSIDRALACVERSTAALSDLDLPVLPALGLHSSQLLTRQRDVFSDHDDVDAVTFRQLAYSRLGFRYRADAVDSVPHGDESERRMAASVVRRWLRRTVLPPQTLLVDAPHLGLRMWQLMGENPSDENWRGLSTVGWGDESPWVAPLEANELVRPFLDVPVYAADEASDVLTEFDFTGSPSAIPDLVFAEDSSVFLPYDDAEAFASDLPGPFARRAVEIVTGVGYEPAPRLLT